MAKSMQTMEMDFENARKQANELEQIAKNLITLVNHDFEPCLRGISTAWKGENANAFCKKGTVIAARIAESASDLKKTAVVIREIAENTYQAEKQVQEIAQIRKR